MRHTHSTFDLDARIRRIAAKQLGLITVEQATTCGVDKHALARRRDAGALVPVFREVMRLAPFAGTPEQRALAAALVVPGSIVAATSAALVHEMPVPARLLRTANAVLSVVAVRHVRRAGITVVRQSTAPRSTAWLTTRVTTPAETLVLLPRFVDEATVERCLDHALAHRLTTVDQMRRRLAETPAHAVHQRQLLLSLLAERSDGIGHRSGKEQQVGRWLRRAGLKGWVRNYAVRVVNGGDDVGDVGDSGVVEVEVDFGWPHLRIALEVSPFFTHGSRAKQARDAERRRLLVLSDWRVVDAVDHDIANESAFARSIATLRSLGVA